MKGPNNYTPLSQRQVVTGDSPAAISVAASTRIVSFPTRAQLSWSQVSGLQSAWMHIIALSASIQTGDNSGKLRFHGLTLHLQTLAGSYLETLESLLMPDPGLTLPPSQFYTFGLWESDIWLRYQDFAELAGAGAPPGFSVGLHIDVDNTDAGGPHTFNAFSRTLFEIVREL